LTEIIREALKDKKPIADKSLNKSEPDLSSASTSPEEDKDDKEGKEKRREKN
jgi:hypothetical protein